MAELVYALCALTSAACAVLLVRASRRTRSRLLVWSALCFIGLTLNNILLFVDLVVVPETDLSGLRAAVAVVGLACLVHGLIWDVKS